MYVLEKTFLSCVLSNFSYWTIKYISSKDLTISKSIVYLLATGKTQWPNAVLNLSTASFKFSCILRLSINSTNSALDSCKLNRQLDSSSITFTVKKCMGICSAVLMLGSCSGAPRA